MILEQDPLTGFWTDGPGDRFLTNVHDIHACSGVGCAVHDRPSSHRLASAPLNWREDRNILERICEHGVGHPDYDSAIYLESIGQGIENVHGCDGCC
jgi:hypothetical protein